MINFPLVPPEMPVLLMEKDETIIAFPLLHNESSNLYTMYSRSKKYFTGDLSAEIGDSHMGKTAFLDPNKLSDSKRNKIKILLEEAENKYRDLTYMDPNLALEEMVPYSLPQFKTTFRAESVRAYPLRYIVYHWENAKGYAKIILVRGDDPTQMMDESVRIRLLVKSIDGQRRYQETFDTPYIDLELIESFKRETQRLLGDEPLKAVTRKYCHYLSFIKFERIFFQSED